MKTEEVKLHSKDFENMELTELYAERSVRKWHRSQMKRHIERLKKRRWWLEQNRPILSDDEIRAQYENGELTKGQYQSAFGRRKLAIDYRMRNEDCMIYADRIAFHEEAMMAYIDELIAQKLAEQKAKPGVKEGYRKYDPRKKVKKKDKKKLDPNRLWATREAPKSLPELQKARARWKKGNANDRKAVNLMKRMQPVVYWDIDTLRQIARDRGYFNDVSMSAVISEALNITISGAKSMLESGRLTWSQCIIIGAVLEMTPKEFCDTFLHGYFREVADGVYKAHVDDTEALLDAPYRAKPLIREDGEIDHE